MTIRLVFQNPVTNMEFIACFGNTVNKQQKQLIVGLTFSKTELIHTNSASLLSIKEQMWDVKGFISTSDKNQFHVVAT